MNTATEKDRAPTICSRRSCSKTIEPVYVAYVAERPAKLQALFERMSRQSQLCPTCSADAKAYDRENELSEIVGRRANLGVLPRDIRSHRLELSNVEFEKQNAEAWRIVRSKYPILVKQRSIAFEGPPGVGKTWAAHCLLNSRLDRGESIASISTLDVLDGREVGRFARSSWLHLDDFDKVEWTQKKCLRLFHLLNGVVDNHGYVVLCLNGSLEAVYEAQKRAYKGKWETVRALFDRLAPCRREPMSGENLRTVANL